MITAGENMSLEETELSLPLAGHRVSVSHLPVSPKAGSLVHTSFQWVCCIKSNPAFEQAVPGPSIGASRVCGQNSQQNIHVSLFVPNGK